MTVWVKGMVKSVDRGIREAGLGLNPQTEGNLIRIPLPEMTEDRRKELVKVAHKYSEQAKVAVRNVRRDLNHDLKELKDEKMISEDDFQRGEKQLQEVTDKFIAQIEEIGRMKEAEIMEV